MKRKIFAAILALSLVFLFATGCGTEAPQTAASLPHDTFEEFAATGKHLHPATDGTFRYAVYDTFAQVIECLSDSPNIAIPDTYENVPVIGIRASVFAGNTTMKHLLLGKNVLQIGASAFQNCTALTQVKMTNSVNDIGVGAFSGCTALTSIVIPPRVSTLYSGTFSGCESLQKVVIEPNVTEPKEENERTAQNTPGRVIESGVFSNCPKLAIMWIPEDIVTVQDSIFGGSTPKPLICGGDATASSWFATLQCLDYEVVARDDFNTRARLYQESLSTPKTAIGTVIPSGAFQIELSEVNRYDKLGNITAGDNHVLLAAKFKVHNGAMIPQYFDGLRVSCVSTAPGKDGTVSDFVKYPLLLSSDVLGLSYPVGNINSKAFVEGVIVLRVSDRYDSVRISFDGASEPFIL